jgi:hypothetical protein
MWTIMGINFTVETLPSEKIVTSYETKSSIVDYQD